MTRSVLATGCIRGHGALELSGHCGQQFLPEGVDSHSSSIVDLIDSCKSATDFIAKLKWPNEYENAKYLTALSHASRFQTLP